MTVGRRRGNTCEMEDAEDAQEAEPYRASGLLRSAIAVGRKSDAQGDEVGLGGCLDGWWWRCRQVVHTGVAAVGLRLAAMRETPKFGT